MKRFVSFLKGVAPMLLCLSCFLLPAHAELQLASVFGDLAVLQREKPVPVWGRGTPGAEVTVAFAGQRKSAVCNAEGEWRVVLDPMPASHEGREMTITSGNDREVLNDVLVGEVWLAAGQSNMNHSGPDRDVGIYPFYQSPDDADLPEIRVRRFGVGVSLEPLSDLPELPESSAAWSTRTQLGNSTNMPLYFARILRDQLRVPVGILHVAVSGTNQVAWMARETVESFPASNSRFENFYEEFLQERQEGLASRGDFASFEAFKEQEAEWARNPSGNWPGRRRLELAQFPTVLYNTRIYPLQTYAMRGLIWHQGEAGPRGPFAERHVAKFQQWRRQFDQDLYVIWGTLSRHTRSQPPLNPGTSGFYRSGTSMSHRHALNLFGEDPRVDFVEIYDLGNHDTHFDMKAEGGRRYALSALRLAYGLDAGLPSGPRLASGELQGNEAVLTFDLVGNGLHYRPSLNAISGFFVFGGGEPAWGEVEQMDNRTLRVRHPNGHALDRVSYGMSPNPHETLFNSDGLPASPFNRRFTSTRPQNMPSEFPLIQQEENKGAVSILHVRRGGYRFEIRTRNRRDTGTSIVLLWVPEEWQAIRVERGTEPLEFEPKIIDGNRFLRVEVPINRSIRIADTRVMEEMREENRF